jgi:hypothetical protein
MEFMPLPIERLLCGDQIRWSYVGCGSNLDSGIATLAAEKASSE